MEDAPRREGAIGGTNRRRIAWSVVCRRSSAASCRSLWSCGTLSFDPLRTAYGRGLFSNFYDIQARSLLDGNLDVPPGSLGIEEFIVRGRSYMYFPPFPALLRMPVLLFTDSLDGDLTALSMLAGWAVFAFATARLIWMARRNLRGDEPVGRAEAALAAILLASITGGSTMLFLASQPFVFHEVYVWSTALTIERRRPSPRHQRTPIGRTHHRVRLAGDRDHSHPNSGWMGNGGARWSAVAVWIRVRRPYERSKPLGQLLTGAAIFAVVVGASVNWAKFHHAYRFPIADQVWSQINPARQASLAANGDRLDGIQFVATTILTYFRPDGIRFVPYLPFVTLPAHPPSAVGDVVLDQTYRTGSITAFMPLLLTGHVWGTVGVGPLAARRWADADAARRSRLSPRFSCPCWRSRTSRSATPPTSFRCSSSAAPWHSPRPAGC